MDTYDGIVLDTVGSNNEELGEHAHGWIET